MAVIIESADLLYLTEYLSQNYIPLLIKSQEIVLNITLSYQYMTNSLLHTCIKHWRLSPDYQSHEAKDVVKYIMILINNAGIDLHNFSMHSGRKTVKM